LTRSAASSGSDPFVKKYRPGTAPVEVKAPEPPPATVPEIGGRKDGTDPTRYGDWEKNGRCIDF
jgi:hypothetical protein